MTDLDVTCPDLESEGNGVDAQEVCLDLVTQVHVALHLNSFYTILLN